MESDAKPSGAKLNRLRAQWEQGKCTLGAIATIPSVQAVQVMARVAHTAAQANAMIARGYKALVVGFDWSLLHRGIASAIADIRTGLN